VKTFSFISNRDELFARYQSSPSCMEILTTDRGSGVRLSFKTSIYPYVNRKQGSFSRDNTTQTALICITVWRGILLLHCAIQVAIVVISSPLPRPFRKPFLL